MVTRWEVQKAVFASRMEPAGRHLMHALIAGATGNTVDVPSDHAPNYDELAAMTGLSRSTVSEWMKTLAAAGWYERDGSGRNAAGYTLAVGDPDAAAPKRASRRHVKKAISPPGGSKEAVSGVAPQPPTETSSVRQADQNQGADDSVFSPPGVTNQSAGRTEDDPPGGLNGDAPIRNLPTGDAVPPDSPPSPSPGAAAVNDEPASVGDWRASDRKTTPAVVAQNPPRTERQSGLFAVAGIKLSEAQQTILDWLHWNGYPVATEADARAVHALVREAFPGKATPGYIRGIAKPDGSGFGVFYDQLRKDRATRIDRDIRALELSEPECEHGTLAGRHPHPVHGVPLCPLCRAGLPAITQRPGTHPDVVAALSAYLADTDRTHEALELIKLTQGFEAFRIEGAGRAQLIELARRAAKHGGSLIAAAREDA